MSKQSYGDNSPKKPFWKRNITNIPGSSVSSSPNTALPNKSYQSKASLPNSRHKLTFEEFENHTQDAWDAAEDDLLRSALAKINVGSSYSQVHATAQAVIDQHAQTRSNPPTKSKSVTTTSQLSATPSNRGSHSTSDSRLTSESPISLSSHKKFPGGAARTNVTNAVETENIKLTAEISPDNSKDLSDHSDNLSNSPRVKRGAKSDITLLPPDLKKAGSAPKAQSIRMPIPAANLHKENSRIEKFKILIESDSTDLDDLRKLSWSGIPSQVRAETWQLLSGYLPATKDRRNQQLTRKRAEYFNFVKQYYEAREQPMYQATFHQIHIDIPRTNPLVPLFQQSRVQMIFERLLFVWAVRHPASGYVQGINDLVTPFFVVFLTAQIGEECDVETYDVTKLSESILKEMEADTFWCMNKLLDGIQDNYTFAQPGVQSKVNQLRELTKRVDAELHAHLEAEQIEYLQFAFRWMNNLLMREIPLRCTIRLWDTYLAETDGFSDFHLYVCAAFLKLWREQLLSKKDFQELMLLIQNVPTYHWGEEEVKLLLAESFRLKYTFADAPSHLPSNR